MWVRAQVRTHDDGQLLGVIPGAKQGCVDHALRMARSTVTVELYLDPASDPISGSVVYPDGRKLPFAGWIELTAALEDARRSGALDVVAHGNESGAPRPDGEPSDDPRAQSGEDQQGDAAEPKDEPR